MADGHASKDGFHAPGEWERHEKCWMMWPVRFRKTGPEKKKGTKFGGIEEG